MDSITKIWMYEHWVEDQNDDYSLAKNHAYLLGSFWNPELVQKLAGADKSVSSNDDFEESLNMVKRDRDKDLKASESSSHRRRKKIKV